MGMMLRKGMLPRKQRTAYLKSDRPKYGRPKPMSDEWRQRNHEGDPKAKVELKKHYLEASQASGRMPDAPAAAKKKPDTVVVRGTKMQAKNFAKNFASVRGYRVGGADVSKKAMKTQGPKAVTDAIKGDYRQGGNFKKMPRSASEYDKKHGFPSGVGPKRVQTDAVISGIKRGSTGKSLWTAYKEHVKSGY